MVEFLCDCFFTCCIRIKHHYISYFNAMLPGLLTPSKKTLIRLLAVGFNNLDGRSGLFPPAPLQTCCVYAAGLQRSRVLVSGTRTGSHAVATVSRPPVNSSHGHLITRSFRHTVNSSPVNSSSHTHTHLITVNTSQDST